MSWLYSRVLVDEFLEENSTGGEPFAQSNSTSTPEMYLSHDKTTEHSRLSRYGMTLQLLTEDHGEGLLTWFREASHARTLAAPEKDADWTESEAGYGQRWRELLVKYDPATSSWKTHRCLFQEDLIGSCLTLPRWGSMRNGELLELRTPLRFTSGRESGLWQLPTPTAQDYKRRGPNSKQQGLSNTENWVRTWPTPTRSDHKGSSANAKIRKDGKPRNDRLDHVLENGNGRLNPDWVEWLEWHGTYLESCKK